METIVCTMKVVQALRPELNLVFYHFDCTEQVLKTFYLR